MMIHTVTKSVADARPVGAPTSAPVLMPYTATGVHTPLTHRAPKSAADPSAAGSPTSALEFVPYAPVGVPLTSKGRKQEIGAHSAGLVTGGAGEPPVVSTNGTVLRGRARATKLVAELGANSVAGVHAGVQSGVGALRGKAHVTETLSGAGKIYGAAEAIRGKTHVTEALSAGKAPPHRKDIWPTAPKRTEKTDVAAIGAEILKSALSGDGLTKKPDRQDSGGAKSPKTKFDDKRANWGSDARSRETRTRRRAKTRSRFQMTFKGKGPRGRR